MSNQVSFSRTFTALGRVNFNRADGSKPEHPELGRDDKPTEYIMFLELSKDLVWWFYGGLRLTIAEEVGWHLG